MTRAAPAVLLVVTSHATMGEKSTGFWLEEVAVPYLRFVARGCSVVIASPLGGKAPADPGSLEKLHGDVASFWQEQRALLDNTVRLADVDASAFDAVFLAGGHGTMFDLPASTTLRAVLEKVWARHGVVAAVCHGPAGLVGARDANHDPIVKGRRVTAFSNEEEEAAGLTKLMPFLLEDRLRALGGSYAKAAKWQAHAVRDGRLVTGQNPASSGAAADEVLAALQRA